MAKKVQASLLYLANPDNPMGTFHPKTAIEEMISNLPESSLLCLDEAYSEFVPRHELPKIDPDNPHVIRMRTFSKGYGMAGARIGYAIATKKLIKSFDKIRNHFGINFLGQRAALIALLDQDYLNAVIGLVNRSKSEITKIASSCGLKAITSSANFVALDCGGDTIFAKAVLAALVERQIFVRMPLFEPQSRCIRISAGGPNDIKRLSRILPEVLNSIDSSKNF